MVFIPSVIAPSNSGNSLGYELLDGNSVLRIWNNFDSYYFNTSNGMQFTNHYQKYWTHNVMMLGYYSGDSWHLLFRTDELSGFNKNIDLSESFCNATLWKDLSYAGYSFRLAIRYCLGVNDLNLTVIPYIKNLGVDIPYQLAFGWELKDIKIDMKYENNFIEINDTEYSLFGELNNSYSNLTKTVCEYDTDNNSWNNYTVPNPMFTLKTSGYYLYLNWDSDLDYLLTVKNRTGQYNAPVTLFIKIGALSSSQEKYTSLHWFDSVLTLRPSANGTYTNLFVYAGTGSHWELVDDTGSGDGDSTGVFDSSSSSCLQDTYNISNHTTEVGTIYGVTINGRFGFSNYYAGNYAVFYIITDGSQYNSGSFSIGLSRWELKSYNWSLNPKTGVSWTWNDIDNLEIGICCGSGGPSAQWVSCTQVYLEVNFTEALNVSTNASTGVEETNATLNGYVSEDNGTGCTVFFQYGTTTVYGTNTSSQYPKYTGDSFSANVSGLNPGTLYHYRAFINNTNFSFNGTDMTFTTKPDPPTNTTIVSFENTINLSWTTGNGSSKTYIERNTTGVTSWSRGSGTNIYNGTNNYFNDTTLVNGTKYYYQLWSYTDTNFSDDNVSVNNITYPVIPTNVVGTGYGSYLNITWIKGNGADTTLIRKETSSYPDSVTDGTLCQNNSLSYYNLSIGDNDYFSFWSYNSTLNIYSSRVTFLYGGLIINVFDANTTLNVTNWNVTISNEAGSSVYSRTDCNNTLTIDITDCPQGLVSVIVSHMNYSSSVNYITIYNGNWYSLNVYLISNNISNLYYLQVLDDNLYPVGNAEIVVKGYINSTNEYETFSTLVTDGYGYASCVLQANKNYKVVISKSGFTTSNFDWYTDPVYYGIAYPKIFRITHNFTVNETYGFWDVITFNATMYTNQTILVCFVDSKTNTTDTSFYTYDVYNYSSILKATNISSSDSFSFWVMDINDTRMHQITLYLNHTNLGFVVMTISVSPVNITTDFNTTNIESKISGVFGSFSLGYVNFFLIFIPAIVILILPGPGHIGIGVIGAGLWIGVVSQFLSVPSNVILIVPLIIAMGVLLIIVKEGRNKL